MNASAHNSPSSSKKSPWTKPQITRISVGADAEGGALNNLSEGGHVGMSSAVHYLASTTVSAKISNMIAVVGSSAASS